MKQSLGLIILQITGIVLGVISVFWVAGSMSPEVYAIVGVYSVISSLMLVFSNTGIETYAIRNVLAWNELNEHSKIRLVITQAITFRVILASILVIPILGYVFFVSRQKFDDQYFGLFFLMSIFGIAHALNNSIILLLKAFNKYLTSAFVSYSVNVFGRIFALILFFKYGFNAYIYTLIVLPLIVILPVFFIIRKWINFKGVFLKKNILWIIYESNSFRISSYISFVFVYLDQLFVSIFMSAETLGSFTVAKSILSMAKTFIENIFDPLIQNLVRLRNDIVYLQLKLRKVVKLRNILLVISFIFLPFLIIYIDRILVMMRLDSYVFLSYFIIFIYLSQIAHIGMKIKYNYITLFFKSSLYLRLTAINAILSVLFFIIILLVDIRFIFCYVLLTNLVMIIYSNKIYTNKKNN